MTTTWRRVRAQFEYKDAGPGLLYLARNQELWMIQETGNGWAEGQTDDDVRGFFPISFVTVIPTPPGLVPPVDTGSADGASGNEEPGSSKRKRSEKSKDGKDGKERKTSSSSSSSRSSKSKTKSSASLIADDKDKDKDKDKEKRSKKRKGHKHSTSSVDDSAVQHVSSEVESLATQEPALFEASVQWALSTLKLEASASAADIESATRALLDHPAELKEYLTKLAKLDGDLQLYLRQGQDGVDAKLVQKQLSAQDGWKDAFEMQVFENNQLLIEQRREQATLLGAEATSLLALASEIHGLSQAKLFGSEPSAETLQALAQRVAEAVKRPAVASSTPKLVSLRQVVQEGLEQVRDKQLALESETLILTQIADQDASIGAARIALYNTFAPVVAASIAMHRLSSTGTAASFSTEPDHEADSSSDGDDQVLTNSLLKRQFRELLSFAVPLGPLSIPTYSIIARLFSRHASRIAAIPAPEYHCQFLSLLFIDSYREQIRKLSPLGATALAVGGGVRMLCALCDGSIDLNGKPAAQLLARIGSVKTSKGRVCVMQDKKRALALQVHQELLSYGELEERIRLFQATVADGTQPKAKKVARYLETGVHEQSGWSTAAGNNLDKPGETLDVLFYGSRYANADVAAELLLQGWHVSLQRTGQGSGDAASSSSSSSSLLDELRPEIARVAADVAANKSAIERLQGDVDSVRGLGTHLQQLVKQQTAGAEARDRDLADAKSSISSIHEQLASLNSDAQRLQSVSNDHHSALESVRARVEQLSVASLSATAATAAVATSAATHSDRSVPTTTHEQHIAAVHTVVVEQHHDAPVAAATASPSESDASHRDAPPRDESPTSPTAQGVGLVPVTSRRPSLDADATASTLKHDHEVHSNNNNNNHHHTSSSKKSDEDDDEEEEEDDELSYEDTSSATGSVAAANKSTSPPAPTQPAPILPQSTRAAAAAMKSFGMDDDDEDSLTEEMSDEYEEDE